MGDVRLRFVEEKDASFVQKYASEKKVSDTCLLPYPYPENGGEEWVNFAINNRKRGTSLSYAILYKEEFSGVVSFINIEKEEGTSNLGYWIGSPFWNKRIGTTAIKEILKIGFNELGLKEIKGECLEKNVPSIKILKNNGFSKKDDFIYEEGKFAGEKGILYSRIKG